jgi:hypothetical protein
MRPETVKMALRFLDAAFGGSVEDHAASDGRLVVKISRPNLTHEVVVAADLLQLEPTAVMAPLRDVPTVLRNAKAALRVTVTTSGLSTEPLTEL